MNIIEPILLGLVLSADSFSAAIAMGLKAHRFNDALKFAALSGGAELIATLLGALMGHKIVSQFGAIDHWIAFLLLMAVALHMLYEGVMEWKNQDMHSQMNFHGFFKLFIVAFATSLDALAIGVSLAMSDKVLWPYLISIGSFAFILTILGMAIAKQLPKRFAALFNVIAACVLIMLAIQMRTI